MRYILIHIPTSHIAYNRYSRLLSFKDRRGAEVYLEKFGHGSYTVGDKIILGIGSLNRQHEFCIAESRDLYGLWNRVRNQWESSLGMLVAFLDRESAANYYATNNWMCEIRKL